MDMSIRTTTQIGNRRHFGSVISANASSRSQQKAGDAREKNSQAYSKNVTKHNQYTVSFDPGPIGLELEPGTLPQSGGIPCCRVQRFVDGGPRDPGPARASGNIQPGDVVVAVNGSPVKTYEQTISILKQSVNTREITFQSAWADLPVSDLRKPQSHESSPDGPVVKIFNEGRRPMERSLRSSSFDLSFVVDESDHGQQQRSGSNGRSLQKSRSETWKYANAMAVESSTSPLNHRLITSDLSETTLTPVNRDVPNSKSSSPLLWSSSTTRSTNTTSGEGNGSDEICDHVANFASWLIRSNDIESAVARTPYSSERVLNDDRAEKTIESVRAHLSSTRNCMEKSTSDKDVRESTDMERENMELKQALVKARLEIDVLKAHRSKLELEERTKVDRHESISTMHEELAELRMKNKLLEERRCGDGVRIAELEATLKETIEARKSFEMELISARSLLRKKDSNENTEKNKLQIELEKMIRSLRQENENRRPSEDAMKAMSREIEALRMNIEARDKEGMILRDALEQRTLELQDIREEAAVLGDEIAETNEIFEYEICSLRHSLSEAHDQLAEMDESVALEKKDHQAVLERMLDRLKDSHLENELLREAVQMSRNDLKRAQNTFGDEVRLLKEALSPHETHQPDLRIESPEPAQNLSPSGFDSILVEMVSLRDEVLKTQQQCRRLRKERDRLLDMNEIIQETLDELSEERDLLLESQNEDSSNAWKSKLEIQAKEIAQLREQLEHSRKSQDEAFSRSKEVEDKLIERSVTLQSELADKESKLSFVRDTLKITIDVHEPSCSREDGEEKNTSSLEWDTKSLLALQAQLFHAKTEEKALKRRIRSLEGSLSVVQHEKDEISARKEQVMKDFLACREMLGEQELKLLTRSMESTIDTGEIEDMEQKLNKKTDELALAESSIEAFRQQCIDLNSKLTNAREMAKKAGEITTSELIKCQDEATELKRHNIYLEKKIQSMHKKLAEAEEKIVSSTDKIATARELMTTARENAEQESQRFLIRMDELTVELRSSNLARQQLEKANEELNRECLQLKKGITDLEHERVQSASDLEERINILAQERDLLTDKAAKQKQVSLDLAQQLQDSKAKNEESQKEIESLLKHLHEEQKLGQYQTDTQQKKHEREKEKSDRFLVETTERLRQAKHDLSITEEALDRARSEIIELSSDLDEAKLHQRNTIDEFSEKHTTDMTKLIRERDEVALTLRLTQEDADKMKSSMETELAVTRSSFIRMEKENRSMTEKIRENEERIESLLDTVAQLKEEYVDCSGCEETTSFFGLPRADLRSMCQDLRDELALAEKHLDEERKNHQSVASDLSYAHKRIAGLEAELTCMSEEIGRMIHTTKSLEKQILELNSSRSIAENRTESLKSSLESEQRSKSEVAKELAAQLEKNESLLKEIEMARTSADSSCRKSETDVKRFKDQIEHLSEAVGKGEEVREKLQREIETLELELVSSKKERDENTSKANALGAKLVLVEDELTAKIGDFRRVCDELETFRTKASSDNDEVNKECSRLREQLAELVAEAENNRKMVLKSMEKEKTLMESTAQFEQLSSKNEKLREETAIKLAEASKVTKAQKVTIMELETNKLDAEKRASSLSSQIENLRDVVKRLEEASDATGEDHIKQMELLENRNGKLSEENDQLSEKCAKLGDDLRQSRRMCDEFRRTSVTLKKRIDQLKHSLAEEQEEKHSRCLENVQLHTANKDCRFELESKKMENDHLKARAQVLNATIARLKSSQFLFPVMTEICTDSTSRELQVSSAVKKLLLGLGTDLDSFAATLQQAYENYKRMILQADADERFKELDLSGIELVRSSQTVLYLKEVHNEIMLQAKSVMESRAIIQTATAESHVSASDAVMENTHHESSSNADSHREGLVVEMREAHDALRIKNKMIADLEFQLREKQNSEELPGKQENNAKEMSSWNSSNRRVSVAAQMIGRFFEDQDIHRMNSALRRWTALASSRSACEKQDAIASELSAQLETTREKLSILKKHLKKSRRAPMARIMEAGTTALDQTKVDV